MMPERDLERFARLIEALRPWLGHVVIVGGWAHRLFRNHPLAQAVPYPPLTTRDTDVALLADVPLAEPNLRERLLAHGFYEEFVADDRPPVTHYRLGDDDLGFYVEFLTPLVGSEFKRDETRDVTTKIAGVTAQKLRYLDVLLIAPWSVHLDFGSQVRASIARINIANPVAYITQKLLIIGTRKPNERAKDVLYIHDTLELFGGSMPEVRRVWTDRVRPQLAPRALAKVRQARARLFADVTDTVREATLMATGRALSPEAVLEVCRAAFTQVFD